MKKLPIIFIVILGVALGLLFLFKNNSVRTSFKSTHSVSSPSPTPFAFQELTIPYLRTKTYDSKLGSQEVLSDNGVFTSSLTSYTSEGLKINALITVPDGEKPAEGWPAIVFIHGYIPPTQYETNGQAYSAYVDYLAKNGFVVLKIDLRGHGDSEGRPGGGYFGADYVTDALNAYSALEHANFVNKKKIGLWGHSMAGNIVMRSLAVKPEIPAAVIWAGAVYSYVDQAKYGINDNSYRPQPEITIQQGTRQKIRELYGPPSEDNFFWRKMAPVNYVQDLKGAIQIHHAEDDTVVNIGYSRDLMKYLDKTSIPHELFEYSSGGHNISGENFTIAMNRTVDFFKKYLNK